MIERPRASSKIACGQRFAALDTATAAVVVDTDPPPPSLGPPATDGIIPPVGDITYMV